MHLSTPQSAQNSPSTRTNQRDGNASPFLHQSYTAAAPRVACHYLRATTSAAIGSADFRRRMRAVGDVLCASRVCAVYLVHGSFAALDSLSILSSLARHYRAGRRTISRIAAQIVDADIRDAGNYTPRYAEAFETAIGARTPVRLVSWSSENHHLGRADAAVRLLDELASLELSAGQRILLWGHGHAGNVFAMMSQLLSAGPSAVERFFAAASVYYRWPLAGLVDIPVWQRVRQLLARDRHRIEQRPCDYVTFGTPVRYGWALREHDRLLHFVYHRPSCERASHLAVFPSQAEEFEQAAGGDYLQQIAIAGTDAPPSPLAWRAWLANRRLGDLLAADCGPSDLGERLRTGTRVHDCGTTLLVDYGPPAGSLSEHLAGHAVYARPEWLLLHAEKVVEHLYSQGDARTQAA